MFYRSRRSVTSGLAGAIVLIGLLLAFVFGFGDFNLPIFFVALGFASLVGSLGTLNPRAVYGGLIGCMWMFMLALFFITGSWLWFLVGAIISAIMGSLLRPILAGLMGMGLFGLASTLNQQPPQQPYYQPPQSPQQPYQSYGQGYQPPPQQPETYQEGGQPYQYPPQTPQPSQHYEQPQAQYPQQMPPPQQ